MTDQGSLRDRQRELTRRRLLDSAAALFDEVGYLGVTIEDIARSAGASRATFYLHFKSKAEIAAALGATARDLATRMYGDLRDMLVRVEEVTWASVRDWLAEHYELWRGEAGARIRSSLQSAALDAGIQAGLIGVSSDLVGTLGDYFDALPAEERRLHRQRLLLVELMTERVFWLAADGQLDRIQGRTESSIDEKDMLATVADLWYDALVTHYLQIRGEGRMPDEGTVGAAHVRTAPSQALRLPGSG